MATYTDTLDSSAGASSAMWFDAIIASLSSSAVAVTALGATRVVPTALSALAAAATTMEPVRLVFATADSAASEASLMHALMRTYDRLDSQAAGDSAFPQIVMILPLPGGGERETNGVSTWVVNIENSATSRFEQYEFNSFAKIDGYYYGAGAHGIYRLDGDSDVGAPIRAMFSLGKQDFNELHLKRVPYAYIGVSSSNRMYLKVRINDREYIYRTRGFSPTLAQQRFDIGRGLTAAYWEFEVYNQDGADFEIADIEFVPVTLERRI